MCIVYHYVYEINKINTYIMTFIKNLNIFETIHDKMGFKHLESGARNEDNATDIFKNI